MDRSVGRERGRRGIWVSQHRRNAKSRCCTSAPMGPARLAGGRFGRRVRDRRVARRAAARGGQGLCARPGDRAEVASALRHRPRAGRRRARGDPDRWLHPLGPKLDALLDGHRMRVVHPVPAVRRIVRASTRREVVRHAARPAAGAIASSTSSCVPVAARAPASSRSRCSSAARTTSAAGAGLALGAAGAIPASGGCWRCSSSVELARPATRGAAARVAARLAVHDARARGALGAASCSRSASSTACGRSTSSPIPACAAGRHCTGSFSDGVEDARSAPTSLEATTHTCPSAGIWRSGPSVSSA